MTLRSKEVGGVALLDGSPSSLFSSLVRNKYLLSLFIRRELTGRYRGSLLGILWPFMHPFLMLIVYTFAFGMMMKPRGHELASSPLEFGIAIFSGLMVFNFFAECLQRAPTLLQSHSNLVKKVVFPLEILPVAAAGSAFIHALVSFLIWALFYTLIRGALPPGSAFLFPIVLMSVGLFTLGVSWVLSGVAVFLKDVQQVVGPLLSILLFVSPIFYPGASFPEKARWVLHLNPIRPAVEMAHQVLMEGKAPEALDFFGYLGFSLITCWLGYAIFQRARRGFADVL